MSNTEDYLDGLLNSMEGKKAPDVEEPGQMPDMDTGTKENSVSPEDEFLNAFEKDIFSEDDTDDFIRQFERELDGDTDDDDLLFGGDDRPVSGGHDDSASGGHDDSLVGSLGGIVDSVKEQMQEDGMAGMGSDLDDLMVDNIGDLPGQDMDLSVPDMFGSAEKMSQSGEEPSSGLVDDDADLMDLLRSEGDFSDIGDMLKADEEDTMLTDTDAFSEDGEQMSGGAKLSEEQEKAPGKKRARKDRKQKKAEDGSEEKGFVQKISRLLFGEDEEDGEEQKAAEPVKMTSLPPSIEELSDENLQILRELEGSSESTAEPVEEVQEEDSKEKKKREKEEKKEQAKKEKAAKKEQAKKEKAAKKEQAKKEKKPKPPKEPDNTPPLPKKPVILTFVMAASFLALVLLGTDLFGYSHSMDEAKRAYALGDYTTAYAQVSGMEIKEADQADYEKYRIMANAGGEYSAFQSFMEQGIYDMALDSLIRTIGRCDKYSADAQTYGCAGELSNIRSQAVGALAGFGLTEERAVELYAVSEREEYSAQIYAVLAAAGLGTD